MRATTTTDVSPIAKKWAAGLQNGRRFKGERLR